MFLNKTKISKLIKKIPLYLMTTILLLQINVSKTYADFGDGITGKVANKQVGKLNETLSSLISYAGAFVVVLGVIKLILSIKEEDAGSKVQAFMMIMGGFVFLSAKLIIKAI